MATMTVHPSFRAPNTTVTALRRLAQEYAVEVEVSGDDRHGFRLDFGGGAVEECGFEAAVEAIRQYAR